MEKLYTELVKEIKALKKENRRLKEAYDLAIYDLQFRTRQAVERGEELDALRRKLRSR